MPNWASTSYRIEGSKSDLGKVFNVVDGLMTGKRKPVDENAPKDWEGNVVRALGATEEMVGRHYLRGFITECEMVGETIRIEAEEAWGVTDFLDVLTSLLPGLTPYFIVEEPGCQVYATNDAESKHFADKFFVDVCINGNYMSEYFKTEEQAMAYAAELIGKKDISKREVEEWNEQHQDSCDFIYINEFKIVNL